jgi:oligoendopeptidase F
MGNAVIQSGGAENWWIYWSHIRYFFYVYSYASGLLISKSLEHSYRKNPEFIQKIKEFLSTGLALSPEDIFKKLSINIAQKSFWENGLQEIEKELKEAERLAKKLKKI